MKLKTKVVKSTPKKDSKDVSVVNPDNHLVDIALEEANETFTKGIVMNPFCEFESIPTIYDDIYSKQYYLKDFAEIATKDPNVDIYALMNIRRENFFTMFSNRVEYLAMNIIGNIKILARMENLYHCFYANSESDFDNDFLNIVTPHYASMINDLYLSRAENICNIVFISKFMNEDLCVMLTSIFNLIYNHYTDYNYRCKYVSDNYDEDSDKRYGGNYEYNNKSFKKTMSIIHDTIMPNVEDMLIFMYYQLRSELLLFYHKNTLLEYTDAAREQYKMITEKLNKEDCGSVK